MRITKVLHGFNAINTVLHLSLSANGRKRFGSCCGTNFLAFLALTFTVKEGLCQHGSFLISCFCGIRIKQFGLCDVSMNMPREEGHKFKTVTNAEKSMIKMLTMQVF